MRYAIKSPNDKDYIEYPSVTQLTGQIDKGESLLQWAVNQAVDYIENQGIEIEFTPDKIFKEARFAWKNSRDNSADIGAELHNIIEVYIKRAISKNNPLWLDKVAIREFIKDWGEWYIIPFMQFYIWVRDNVKQFIESEKPVVHTNLCYGGTADFIFKNKQNETVLCDLKTKNTLYGDDKYQLSAYKLARQNMKGIYDVLFYGVKSTYEYKGIKIKRIAVLKIARDYFGFNITNKKTKAGCESLEYKDYTKDYKYAIISFNTLLTYFYTAKKRRLKNNKRAEVRK